MFAASVLDFFIPYSDTSDSKGITLCLITLILLLVIERALVCQSDLVKVGDGFMNGGHGVALIRFSHCTLAPLVFRWLLLC